MGKLLQNRHLINIEQGTWYYFTVDLNFAGFASFNFVRYIDVKEDRKAAIVRFLDKDYFPSRDLLLLPNTRKSNFFRAKLEEILSVWTFNASEIGDAKTIDLESDWPKNILDKAGITPSIETARHWTKSN